MRPIAIFILFFISCLASCGTERKEDSVSFNDHSVAISVESELKISNIPYRTSEDGAIWYPVKYRDKVKDIISKVSVGLPFSFTFYDDKLKDTFVARLKSENIQYVSGIIQGGYKIIVDEKYHGKADAIFREVMNGK